MGLFRATYSSSSDLNGVAYASQKRRAIAFIIARSLQHFGAKSLSERTGIPAKDLHRYAKGALINKSNSNRLGKLFELLQEWKQQQEQITGGTAIRHCAAPSNE